MTPVHQWAVFSRLRSGGKFIGIDWFSSVHQDATRGDALDPRGLRRNGAIYPNYPAFDYSAAIDPGAFAREVILRRTMSM
jgi:hypothetical protein